MKGLRATGIAAGVAILAMVSACVPAEQARFGADVERELERGREYGMTVVWAAEQGGAAVIGAGYLERHRLGLGSPFRLIEYALQDPRLDVETSERVAWALLAATLDGAGYRVDPRAVSPTGDVETASRHLELVERAITGSTYPDAGVLAVRLAYAMAEAEGSVATRLPGRVAQGAALIRDRATSRDDARRLLRAAQVTGTDPLSLLTVWRVERRFRVEAPAVLAVGSSLEREAIALAPRLLEGIRAIGERPRVGPLEASPEERSRPSQPLLPAGVAESLAALAAEHDYPPQTPVVVAMSAYRRSGDEAVATAQARFFSAAVNEERLAAEYALLYHRGGLDAGSRLGMLGAAVALRAYAQERPWFPGFEGPARRDLEDRWGIAAVEFPADVPSHWRPYYRRMLETSLIDLQRVLPALDVRGLRIRIEARPGSPGTLAVHDPRTRTMYLPAATGAGTIAHEIAHDLDWQTALRRYNVRGDYATDRAVRQADGRLAQVMLGLTAASISPSAVGHSGDSHATRPAEVFARSVDWFTAVALAREGRINGYLSSVQDDLLTGYGTVTPPDVTGAAGQALVALLDEVAPIYPETRRWFLQSYGQFRAPSAFDLARRILEAPMDVEGILELMLSTDFIAEGTEGTERDAEDGSAEAEGAEAEEVAEAARSGRLGESALVRLATGLAQLERLGSARATLVAALVGTCTSLTHQSSLVGPRRDLVTMVTAARARGIALATAEQVAGSDGRRWVDGQLRGRGERVELEPAAAEGLARLVVAARAASEPAVGVYPTLAAPVPVAVECGAVPFME